MFSMIKNKFYGQRGTTMIVGTLPERIEQWDAQALVSNPYAWVCLRIWPDNLILSVAAGGDVVWSSFPAGIFYHMERLENK